MSFWNGHHLLTLLSFYLVGQTTAIALAMMSVIALTANAGVSKIEFTLLLHRSYTPCLEIHSYIDNCLIVMASFSQ